jgi:hypothetical protein
MTVKVVTATLHRIQRGHGKNFVAEPRPAKVPTARPARVAVMLAVAHKIVAAISTGRLHDQADAAERLGVTRARITQLLYLQQLAPDIQEHVLFLEAVDGIEPLTERNLRVVMRATAWAQQRLLLASVLPSRRPLVSGIASDHGRVDR